MSGPQIIRKLKSFPQKVQIHSKVVKRRYPVSFAGSSAKVVFEGNGNGLGAASNFV